ncbi:hypothetical protein BG011_000367 [Mortierella polycephala]|uniref:Endonuclease/exonuclease/phosphatase domain-containing protein n=1 Tax=Mortierella polycephala TaxID=41804 RepID=A0A9P6TUV7_9FUNG|nr:hypothetical protein BG011_000367 [Mortierella polycephala]
MNDDGPPPDLLVETVPSPTSSGYRTRTATTTTPTIANAFDAKNRTVPLPRPGELLIYDCRPQHVPDSVVTDTFPLNNPPTVSSTSSSSSASDTHTSSPPTPTPAPQEPSFQQENDNGTTIISSSCDQQHSANQHETGPDDSDSMIFERDPKAIRGAPEVATAPTSTTPKAPTTARNTGPDISSRPIRCLQWNIERNYKPDEIIATLTELDADILCIQEIDIGCHRSGHERDHFLEICRSQGLYGGFVPEFWELEHPERKDRDQGGGVHGNAILSKWPVNGFRVLDHVHHAYEWEQNGLKLNEPRLGRRFTIVADIQTPSGPLLCYSAHLEVFTGIVGRISALSDILADAELYSDQYPYQILFGDLNTISHSVARLAKTISTDQYRIGSVGSQEAEWWDRNLWSWHVQDGEFNLALATGGWTWLRRLGFLGLGAGSSLHTVQGCSAFWSADTKYTGWLKRLVEAGLNTVKQARQEQLLSDKLFAAEQRQQQEQRQRQDQHATHCRSSFTELEEIALGDHQNLDAYESDSEKSYQEDGSMILVGRPRSSSIVTMESNLVDKDDEMSSPTWSSPTASPVRQGESDDDDHEGEYKRHRRRQREHGVNVRTVEPASSTPSTPSPTLRLIPPTPKQSRPSGFSLTDEEVYKQNDEERGILLQYDDEDSDYDDQRYSDEYEHHYEQQLLRQYQEQYYQLDPIMNQQNEKDLEYLNDPNDPNADMTLMTSTTSTTAAETMTATTTFTTKTTTATTTMTTEVIDRFQDPQPPFLLSHLENAHPFFSTQRLWSGFTPLVLHQARNPGFYDPWCARNDLTLHNPNFFGLLKAKLDYTLLRNLRCVERHIGNHDFSASDHKWLLVEVEFERDFRTGGRGSGAADTRTDATGEVDADIGVDAKNKDSKQQEDEREYLLPSKEQQYLWWRERRLEWSQYVQPLPPSLTNSQTAKDEDVLAQELRQGNLVLKTHRHRHRKGKKGSSNASSVSTLVVAALTAAAAGGLWWLSRRQK